MNINVGYYAEVNQLSISDLGGELYYDLKVRIVANGMDNIHDYSSMPFYYGTPERRDFVMNEVKSDIEQTLFPMGFSPEQIKTELDKVLPSITN